MNNNNNGKLSDGILFHNLPPIHISFILSYLSHNELITSISILCKSLSELLHSKFYQRIIWGIYNKLFIIEPKHENILYDSTKEHSFINKIKRFKFSSNFRSGNYLQSITKLESLI